MSGSAEKRISFSHRVGPDVGAFLVASPRPAALHAADLAADPLFRSLYFRVAAPARCGSSRGDFPASDARKSKKINSYFLLTRPSADLAADPRTEGGFPWLVPRILRRLWIDLKGYFLFPSGVLQLVPRRIPYSWGAKSKKLILLFLASPAAPARCGSSRGFSFSLRGISLARPADLAALADFLGRGISRVFFRGISLARPADLAALVEFPVPPDSGPPAPQYLLVGWPETPVCAM